MFGAAQEGGRVPHKHPQAEDSKKYIEEERWQDKDKDLAKKRSFSIF
jgi:hypothetical protein